MNPTQHPSEATLFAYASGSLSEPAALVVACHLNVCEECRHSVEIAETVGGIVLDQLPSTPLKANSLADALSRLDAPAPPASRSPPAVYEAWLPAQLSRYHLQRWRWLAPGISQIIVVRARRRRTSARLLRITPHAALPAHGHSADELACVLRGSFSDERGRFAAGDFSEASAAIRHRPVAGPEGCICVVAISGPLRLYGVAGRLIQALFGF